MKNETISISMTLFSNPIIAGDTKEFAVNMKNSLLCWRIIVGGKV